MLRKKYEGFTLVEMLIVMGIIVILMALGIASGRFAINRANKIQHQGAVDNLYQALQAYYTDHRAYPVLADTNGFSTILADETDSGLATYIESGSFDGGSDATYYYVVDDDDQQSMIVCVSLGGQDDEKNYGHYCNGNGFGTGLCTPDITTKDVDAGETGDYLQSVCSGATNYSAEDWTSDTPW